MVADNDAGGISTYAVTGSKYGFSLLCIFILLVPMAYYVQEMTVRLGAVTKRGHAEAIFDGFGPFWGWFSLADLAHRQLADAGHRVHRHDRGHEPVRRAARGSRSSCVTAILFGDRAVRQVLDVREDDAALLPVQPRLHPRRLLGDGDADGAGAGARCSRASSPPDPRRRVAASCSSSSSPTSARRSRPGRSSSSRAPWWTRGSTSRTSSSARWTRSPASLLTCVRRRLHHHRHRRGLLLPPPADRHRGRAADGRGAGAAAARTARGGWARRLFAIGLFDAGFLGALCISLSTSWAVGEVFGWAHSLNKSVRDAPWFYLLYLVHAADGRRGRAHPERAAGHDHDVRAGGGGDAAAVAARLPAAPAERRGAHGRARQHALAEHRQRHDRRLRHPDVHGARHPTLFPTLLE